MGLKKGNPSLSDDEAKAVGKTLNVDLRPGEDEDDIYARIALSPTHKAFDAIHLMHVSGMDGMPDADVNALVGRLERLMEKAKSGEDGCIEDILLAQAHTLDSMFYNLTRKAVFNTNHLEAGQAYFKLALRAQANCRVTLESFANAKKLVVNQTNIAHGPQQINNNLAKNPPNELMEKDDGQRMDAGTQEETVRADPQLEAVGEIDRPKVA